MLLVRKACDCAAEVVTGALTTQGEKNAPILAGIDIGASSIVARCTVAWGSNNHIGKAVPVYVSDSFNVTAEIVVYVLRFECTNDAAVSTGIDVDVPAARGTCHHIGNTVAVGISG